MIALHTDASAVRRTALQKKLNSVLKVRPNSKHFASLLHVALLPQVEILKQASLDLRHAVTRHRLKRIPKIPLHLAARNNLAHRIAEFCMRQLTPALAEGASLKAMAHSYVSKIQERQRWQEWDKAFTPEHGPLSQHETDASASPSAPLQSSPAQQKVIAYEDTHSKSVLAEAL